MARKKAVTTDELAQIRLRIEDLDGDIASLLDNLDGAAQSEEFVDGIDEAVRSCICLARDASQMAIRLMAQERMQASHRKVQELMGKG